MGLLRFEMLDGELSEEDVSELGEFCETVLAERYSPMLAGALRFQADALGLDRVALEPARGGDGRIRQQTTFGEVFPTDHGVVAVEVRSWEGVYRHTPEGMVPEAATPRLILYGIGTEQIRKPLDEIGDLIKERFGVELSESRYNNQQFEKLQEEGRTAPPRPTAEEEASARLLRGNATRRAALGIASSGGLLRQDLSKHLRDDADRSEEIERVLRESPLVDIDLVVTCKGKSTQVTRAPSREALEQMAKSGLRCGCGRDILQERIDEALTLTEHGRKMLNGSYWMTVLVVAELLDLGLGLERMLIEQVVGGDEMDLFVDVCGDLVLMELKDKEFNLGNAYSFGSKTGIYQPKYPVIVTSAYVGNDAKEHFEQAAAARQSAVRFGETDSVSAGIRYIEGLENLRPQLEQLIDRPYRQDAIRVLDRIFPNAAASGGSVVEGLPVGVGRARSVARASSEPASVESLDE